MKTFKKHACERLIASNAKLICSHSGHWYFWIAPKQSSMCMMVDFCPCCGAKLLRDGTVDDAVRAPVAIGDTVYTLEFFKDVIWEMVVHSVKVDSWRREPDAEPSQLITIGAMEKPPVLFGGIYIWGFSAFGTRKDAEEEIQRRKAAKPLIPFTEEDGQNGEKL